MDLKSYLKQHNKCVSTINPSHHSTTSVGRACKERNRCVSTISLSNHSTNLVGSALTYSAYHNIRSSLMLAKPSCGQRSGSMYRGMIGTENVHRKGYSRSALSKLKFLLAHCEGKKETETVTNKTESEVKLGEPYSVTEEEIQAYLASQSGMDRVKYVFRKNETLPGARSEEFLVIFLMTINAGFLTFLGFGRLAFYKGKNDFAEFNKLTAFPSRKIYLSMMHEFGMRRFANIGTKVGFKVGLLTGVFLCLSESISAYRAKSSLVEYLIAGVTAGAMHRWYHGIRGMVLGGVLGSGYGLICGSVFYGGKYILGETQQERLYRRTKDLLQQEKEAQQRIQKQMSYVTDAVPNTPS